MKVNDVLDAKINSLPMLPQAVTNLVGLSPEDSHFFDKVLKTAEEDPSLALRIIKFANSALRAGIKPVSNLKDAIVRIGSKSIFELVASVSVITVFVPTTRAEKRIWLHSLEVAMLSRMLASELFPNGHQNADEAYLSGLLHDIGLFLMFSLNKTHLEKVNEYKWATPAEHYEAEKKVYGTQHNILGAYICKIWNVPKNIIWVVKMHHDYNLATSTALLDEQVNLLRIVQLADFISEFMYHDNTHHREKKSALTKAVAENKILTTWLCETGRHIDNKIMAKIFICLQESLGKYKALGLG